MFLINIHCKPTKDNEKYYGRVTGNYAGMLIDFKDIAGAFELARFYLEQNQWEVMTVDDDYFVINQKEDLGEENRKTFDEAKVFGYSMIFNMYLSKE